MDMQPVLEQLVVAAIVATAAGFSVKQLVPARAWRGWLRLLRGASVEQPVLAVRQPHPGCHGCPASADCGKRR